MFRSHVLPNVPELAEAYWITVPGRYFNWFNRDFKPAPFFRRKFSALANEPARLTIAAGGYYEVSLNGEKITPAVLCPTPANFDRLVYYRTFDLSGLLRDGDNVVGVILGNSIYNCNARGVWMQDTITWRDYPRFLLRIDDGKGRPLTVSDPSWQYWDDGPIRIDSIRNGETFDARRELPGWDTPEFDASGWKHAAVGHGPGGVLVPENHPPCVIYRILPMRQIGSALYDSGQNLAGWAALTVRGTPGSTVTLRYSERLAEDGTLWHGNCFVESGDPQTDHYTLKGGEPETWSPRFSYYGFRYIGVEIKGEAEVLSLDACAVGSDFTETGRISGTDPTLERIVELTRWSYRSNFMGYPTDCPSREKQGWTGDALCAVETGLYLYDTVSSYEDWIDSVATTQRPSGQLAAKSPISSSGYTWGFGPAWDSAFILIPDAIHNFTGRDRCIRKHYDGMRRYLDFCADMCPEHIAFGFGLGDWSFPCDSGSAAPPELINTAFYYRDLCTVARFSALLGKPEERTYYEEWAKTVRDAFLRTFRNGNGGFAENDCSSLALSVAFGLAPDPEAVVRLLTETVRRNGFRSRFGIMGAKYVPIVLAEHGRLDDAVRLLLQDQYPGYLWQIRRGATTLWETWEGTTSNGGASLNHIMFGSVPAWCFRYLGGFRFSPDAPGRMTLQPSVSPRVGRFSAVYRGVRSEWDVDGGTCRYRTELPEGGRLDLELPDGTRHMVASGVSRFECPLPPDSVAYAKGPTRKTRNL